MVKVVDMHGKPVSDQHGEQTFADWVIGVNHYMTATTRMIESGARTADLHNKSIAYIGNILTRQAAHIAWLELPWYKRIFTPKP